jgi:UDPglucose--hexose-1-phosphate uridylyltransferase
VPELRKDPVLDLWVIVSEARGARPSTVNEAQPQPDPSNCPFCPGNESETLPEIYALRAPGSAPDTEGWRVRVVPNKFPALTADAAVEEAHARLHHRIAGRGHHEVIVEGEAHTRSFTELAPGRRQEVLAVYRDRLRAAYQTAGIRSAVLIKNVGLAAGASVEHSHSQLIATPVVPPLLEAELRSAQVWRQKAGRCIWCSIVADERQRAERIVAEEGSFLALCPWASRFPYETWVVPLDHESHFEAVDDAVLAELAELLPRILGAIETCLSDPPYNYVIHSAPFPIEPRPDYHWRVAILPRVTRAAGYEQATGLFINPMSPERAAGQLRRLLRSSDR